MSIIQKTLTIATVAATMVTVDAIAQQKQDPTMMVAKVRTPISRTNLVTVLRDGYLLTFGKLPSRNGLAMAWAQVAFENGQGTYTYDHNLGNIGPNAPEQRWYLSGANGNFYRAFNSFLDAAQRYWEVVRRCPGVLERFNAGFAAEAARLLKGCGYFSADLNLYSRALGSLFWVAWHDILPQEGGENGQ